MAKKSVSKLNGTKANALLCPACCVEYSEVEFDFEAEGVVLHNVKALQCPACKEELFTEEQIETIKKRLNSPKDES